MFSPVTWGDQGLVGRTPSVSLLNCETTLGSAMAMAKEQDLYVGPSL